MQELNVQEVQVVSGGIAPIVPVVPALGLFLGIYFAVTEISKAVKG
ncbi:class IIb bacteriocin, lactobin A/cerein 7B family [Chitinimonas sp. BJB300]|nr:class IIb bacteriocin, lactobin A/cerein 7B family [Chitinimonas sp. BJB300]TSJ87752.1 class IIb bacteriocin, lactobin A/cerein 7B family [Chitinimonas sp. BJB300]